MKQRDTSVLGSFCNHGTVKTGVFLLFLTVGHVSADVFPQSWDGGTRLYEGLSEITEQWDTYVRWSFCDYGTLGHIWTRDFLQS